MSKQKLGRNKKWCKAYAQRSQREKNKVLKVLNHLIKFPTDNKAVEYVKRMAVLAHVKIPANKRHLVE